MTTISPRQLDYLTNLVGERLQALSVESVQQALDAIQPDRLTAAQASKVIEQLLALPVDPKPVDSDQASSIEALAAVLDALDGRDKDFAQSLVNQYRSKGALSAKQWPWVETLTQRASTSTSTSTTVEEGMYRHPDGRIVRVYTTRSGHLAAKVLRIEDGHGYLDYAGREPLADLLDEHRLTAEEAAQLGRTYGFCVNCARLLDDDRSLAAGYGPQCAQMNGWHYPSKSEAAAILNRPSVLDERSITPHDPSNHWTVDDRHGYHPNTAFND